MDEMNEKYPVQAVAFSIIFLTAGMKQAMVTAVLILFAAMLGNVLLSISKEEERKSKAVRYVIGGGTGILCFGLLYFSYWYTGIKTEGIALAASLLVTGVLVAVYLIKEGGGETCDSLLYEGAVAFGVTVLLGVIREFFGTGMIFGYRLAEFEWMSEAYGKLMFGFIFAGLGTGVVNAVTGKTARQKESLWVVIPAAVLSGPFVWNAVPKVLGIAACAVMVVVLLLSVRERLKFSVTQVSFQKVPVELITTGLIYMILSFL